MVGMNLQGALVPVFSLSPSKAERVGQGFTAEEATIRFDCQMHSNFHVKAIATWDFSVFC